MSVRARLNKARRNASRVSKISVGNANRSGRARPTGGRSVNKTAPKTKAKKASRSGRITLKPDSRRGSRAPLSARTRGNQRQLRESGASLPRTALGPSGTSLTRAGLPYERHVDWSRIMGRYVLLWLLGVPIPILILIWAFGGLH
jgi:hypothetical protein